MCGITSYISEGVFLALIYPNVLVIFGKNRFICQLWIIDISDTFDKPYVKEIDSQEVPFNIRATSQIDQELACPYLIVLHACGNFVVQISRLIAFKVRKFVFIGTTILLEAI